MKPILERKFEVKEKLKKLKEVKKIDNYKVFKLL